MPHSMAVMISALVLTRPSSPLGHGPGQSASDAVAGAGQRLRPSATGTGMPASGGASGALSGK